MALKMLKEYLPELFREDFSSVSENELDEIVLIGNSSKFNIF
jgi:hypothetical protein